MGVCARSLQPFILVSSLPPGSRNVSKHCSKPKTSVPGQRTSRYVSLSFLSRKRSPGPDLRERRLKNFDFLQKTYHIRTPLGIRKWPNICPVCHDIIILRVDITSASQARNRVRKRVFNSLSLPFRYTLSLSPSLWRQRSAHFTASSFFMQTSSSLSNGESWGAGNPPQIAGEQRDGSHLDKRPIFLLIFPWRPSQGTQAACGAS